MVAYCAPVHKTLFHLQELRSDIRRVAHFTRFETARDVYLGKANRLVLLFGTSNAHVMQEEIMTIGYVRPSTETTANCYNISPGTVTLAEWQRLISRSASSGGKYS